MCGGTLNIIARALLRVHVCVVVVVGLYTSLVRMQTGSIYITRAHADVGRFCALRGRLAPGALSLLRLLVRLFLFFSFSFLFRLSVRVCVCL